MFNQLRDEAKAIIKHIAELTFYMRGGVQYRDLLLNITKAEREVMDDVIEQNLKLQKGSMHPNF